jgi:hypothetical protein
VYPACAFAYQNADNASDCVGFACAWWSLYQLDLTGLHVSYFFNR